jgi:two-component system, NtrC family, response regulator AtoC
MDNKIIDLINIIKERRIPAKDKIKYLQETDENFVKSEVFSNFAAAHRIIQKQISDSKQTFDYLIEVGYIHYELNNYVEGAEYLKGALQFFESEISYKKHTGILDKLGLFYQKIGDLNEATAIFQKALNLSNNENVLKDIIYFSNELGELFLRLDNYKFALQNYRKAHELSTELQDSKRISVCLNNIGNVYFCLENYEKALKYFLKSFDIREKSKDLLPLANSLNNIGVIYHKLEKDQKALEVFQRAYKIHSKLNHKSGIKISLNNLGTSYDKLEEYEKAMEYHQKSLDFRQETGTSSEISNAMNNIGNIFKNTQKYNLALQYYHHALELDEKNIDKPTIVILLINLGSTYLEIKEYDKAFRYLTEGMKTASEIESKESLQQIYKHLSDYYLAVENLNDALDYYKKYSDLRNELQEKKTSNKLLELQLNFEIEQKEKENEIIKLRNIDDKYSLITKDLEQRIEKNFIGESQSIKVILKEALKAAKFKNTNVIITGESGTGKEIIARIIHHASDRKEFGFFPVNCSAIPETLLESEFFGHKKGTFTGAVDDKKGLFELAHKGTLFLDEIADMPLSLQAKLLRAIEERKIKKIGDSEEISVDIRIIAATNQNIDDLIRQDRFRLDLYHRLNTLIVSIPALRTRPEDIEPLVSHFTKELSLQLNKPAPLIDSELFGILRNYDFPGNVRELKNLVERALIICENNVLDKKCFPVIGTAQSTNNIANLNIKQNEELLIKTALEKTKNNKSKAAGILGISRHTLLRRLSEMKIEN